MKYFSIVKIKKYFNIFICSKEINKEKLLIFDHFDIWSVFLVLFYL